MVETDGAHNLVARYWDLQDWARVEELAAILALDQVRVLLHPTPCTGSRSDRA